MVENGWAFLDTLGLDNEERKLLASVLNIPEKLTVSCNEEYCVFYYSLPFSRDVVSKLSFLPSVTGTPVLARVVRKVAVVGLVVPPYIHVIIVVSRMLNDEST